MFWRCAARPAAGTIDRRFEYLVARYYRGVCTFGSRLTDHPVEAVLLTHAAFMSTRNLFRSRGEVRLVTILLTVSRHRGHPAVGQLTF